MVSNKENEREKQEGRYVIQAFDETTWSIVDIQTQQVYALGLTRLGNLMVHVFLAELITNAESLRYLAYAREILGCRVEVSEWNIAQCLLDYILDELQAGDDVANPVDIAIRLGADLHGQRIEWSEQRAH